MLAVRWGFPEGTRMAKEKLERGSRAGSMKNGTQLKRGAHRRGQGVQ